MEQKPAKPERLLPKNAVQRGYVGISNTDREKYRIVES